MALTASFKTDFSAFYDAVRKATGELTDFQHKADDASGSVNKMVDKSATGFDSMKSAMVGAAGALGVAFSVNAVKNFALGVIETAGNIGDMAEKLGISAEAVQRFGYAADQSGASIDTVDSAIKKMNANLAEGSKGTIAALKQVGLRFEDIRKMSPEDAFTAIGDAVANVEDPMLRAKVATELFGKAGQELIPTFLAGLKQVGAETKVMSDDTVKRLKDAEDAWARLTHSVVIYTGELIASGVKATTTWDGFAKSVASLVLGAQRTEALVALAKGVNEVAHGSLSAQSVVNSFNATIVASTGKLGFHAAALKSVALTADQVAAEIAVMDASLTHSTEAQKKQSAALHDITDRLTTSTVKLTEAQRKQIDAATAAGASAATIATAYGLNERAVTQYTKAQLELAKAIPMTNAAVADLTKLVSHQQLQDGLQQINRDTETLTGTFDDFLKRQQKQAIMFPDLTGKLDDFKKEWEKVNGKVKETPPLFVALDKSLDTLSKGFAQLAQISGPTFSGIAQDVGKVISAVHVASDSGKAMKEGFTKGGVEGYGQLATGALGAIGAIDAATNSGSKAISVMGGMAAGAKAGMAFGPYGAAIGAAAGAITGFVKANSIEGKTVSPLRDIFFETAGGLEVLNPQVEKLTGNLTLVQAVFDAKTVEDYNAAIANLNGLFKAEQDALATLTATADKYGLTIEELGPAMARQNLDKQAQQLYKDWQVLNAAGINTTVITTKMASAVNTYTQDAIKMGAEVPEAMRPMLEKMVEMGTLTDASGNKIDSLENSGINFSLTMSEGFKGMIASVEKLADVLSRSLGVAIDTTTAKINKIPSKVPVEIKYTETGAVPDKGGGSVPGYATGTGGFVDFGAGTLAMLHGREAVVPESAVRNASGGGGGSLGGSPTIIINAQGAFFDTPGELQRLADKVNDALTAKYGLTNRLRAA